MAETAFGTTLSIGGSTVGKVKSISGGGQTLNMIDTGNMDSDTVLRIPGLISGNPVTFSVEYEKTASTGNYAVCIAEQEGRESATHTVTFTDTSTISCTGYVTSVSAPEGDTENELTFSVEVTPETVWTHTGVGA